MPIFSPGDHAIAHKVIGGEEITKPCIVVSVDVKRDVLIAAAGRFTQQFNADGVSGDPGRPGHTWLTPA